VILLAKLERFRKVCRQRGREEKVKAPFLWRPYDHNCVI